MVRKYRILLAAVLFVASAVPVFAVETTAIGRISERLAPVVGKTYPVQVIISKVANACAGKGRVFVSNSLIKMTATEDELAFVLAHEFAHLSRGHALVEKRKGEFAGLLAGLATAALGGDGGAIAAAAALGGQAVASRHSRVNELEADCLAIGWLKTARYDTGASFTILRRLGERETSNGWFSNHPPMFDRLSALAPLLPPAPKDLGDALVFFPEGVEFRLGGEAHSFEISAPVGTDWVIFRLGDRKPVECRKWPFAFTVLPTFIGTDDTTLVAEAMSFDRGLLGRGEIKIYN